MAETNAQQHDEPLVDELRSTLCRAISLLDRIDSHSREAAVREVWALSRLVRQAITQMRADGFVNRVLRLDPAVVLEFSRMLMDPVNNHRQPFHVLREELGHELPRMTAYRFACELRETAARIADLAPTAEAEQATGLAHAVR